MRNSIGKRSAPSRESLMGKKKQLFVTVHFSAREVKSAWPAKPTYSMPTLLFGAMLAALTFTIKQGFFSFADMLPVKISISILQSSGS